MSNRCYIEFGVPNDTSPSACLYEGSISDNEDDVSFSFEGPGGLLERAMDGNEAAINELLGRIYMGCQGNGQDMMDFHWDKGFLTPAGFPDMLSTLSIDEATGIVFAEHDRKQMEKDTIQADATKSVPRI